MKRGWTIERHPGTRDGKWELQARYETEASARAAFNRDARELNAATGGYLRLLGRLGHTLDMDGYPAPQPPLRARRKA